MAEVAVVALRPLRRQRSVGRRNHSYALGFTMGQVHAMRADAVAAQPCPPSAGYHKVTIMSSKNSKFVCAGQASNKTPQFVPLAKNFVGFPRVRLFNGEMLEKSDAELLCA